MVRHWQLKPLNSQGLIGKKALDRTQTTTLVATCKEVYPDFLMAKIESLEIGTKIIPYLPESGIRANSQVIVTIASDVPRITNKLFFGFEPEKYVMMDLDAFSGGNDSKGFVYNNSSVPPWDEKYGEKLSYQPVVIKHTEGEKVFHVDLGGLKVGFKKVTLFYQPHARIELYKNTVELIGISTVITTKAGSRRYVYDDSKKEAGYCAENIYGKDSDGNFTDSVKEYKGNVSKAMADDKLTISNSPVSDGTSIIHNAVYLMIVLDDNVADYKHECSLVKHVYKNRKLSVSGGGNKDVLLNEDMKTKARVSSSYLKSRACVASLKGVDYPITYIKAITRSGDVFEFNAGKNITFVSGESHSVFAGKSSDSFFIGQHSVNIQDNSSMLHFPVRENSAYRHEYMGTTIKEFKGEYIDTFYRKLISNRISSRLIYEVDPKSGISTQEVIMSPNIQLFSKNRVEIFDQFDPLLNNIIKDEKSMNNDNGDHIHMVSNPASSCFRVSQTSGGSRAELDISKDRMSMETVGAITTKSSNILHDCKTLVSEGTLILKDGLHTEGNFIVEADNIVLEAKNYMYVMAKDIIMQSSNNVTMLYANSFIAASESSITGDELNSALIMGKGSATIQGTDVSVFAAKNVSVVGGETATLGAPEGGTNIFGIDNGAT